MLLRLFEAIAEVEALLERLRSDSLDLYTWVALRGVDLYTWVALRGAEPMGIRWDHPQLNSPMRTVAYLSLAYTSPSTYLTKTDHRPAQGMTYRAIRILADLDVARRTFASQSAIVAIFSSSPSKRPVSCACCRSTSWTCDNFSLSS